MTGANHDLALLAGGGSDPLREGPCRRRGCADPAVELGLCTLHLGGYRRYQRDREQTLARVAAANYDALVASTRSERDRGADDAPAEADWLWALGEHLAAHGVEPGSIRTTGVPRRALLDALGDYVDPCAGRGHLSVLR